MHALCILIGIGVWVRISTIEAPSATCICIASEADRFWLKSWGGTSPRLDVDGTLRATAIFQGSNFEGYIQRRLYE